MDKLEEANNRLLKRRESLVSTQTSNVKSLILTIPELRKRFEERASQPKKEFYQMSWEEKEEHQKRKSWESTIEIKKLHKAGLYVDYVQTCGVPKIFLNVKLPTDYEKHKSLFITGACGTGKTHKAVSLMKGYVDSLPCHNFVSPYKNLPIFITVPELLMKIRSCFSLNECEEMIVEKYSNCSLLVLDDIGIEKTSEWALQTLYVILNKRYSEQLQTIITSNLSIEEIGEKLRDRIASRIAGMCKIVKLTGKDRRVKNG